MYLENGKISEAQCFRIGLLENITVGMIAVPYITISYAGRGHILGLAAGIIFTAVYAFIMYLYSWFLQDGLLNALGDGPRWFGVLVEAVYALRYLLRAGIILLFFGNVIRTFLLRSFDTWWLIVSFAIICGYGAFRDIEKRGRLLEFLFWWMIIPLILIAVFSVTNIDWGGLASTLSGRGMTDYDAGDVAWCGYLVLIVLSTWELMMFTFSSQKDNSWMNLIKIFIWMTISIIAAYILIIGILGRGWVEQGVSASLNVMEAASIPGDYVERMDYPVLAFWIIGIFAIVSGYMFHAKECIGRLFMVDTTAGFLWVILFIAAASIGLAWLWSIDLSRWLSMYVIYYDIAISLAVPPVVILIKRLGERKSRKQERKKS